MAMKSIILITTLLVVAFVAREANAQALGVTLRINGTVPCSLTSIVTPLNVTITAPPFPNATIQLVVLGIPIGATVRTNQLGQFTLTTVQSALASVTNLLNQAVVVVATPLTACNPTAPPNTFLQSVRPLQLLSNITSGTPLIQANVGGFVTVRI